MSGKSVVGRTGSLRLYKYPHRSGSAALLGPFARNFAGGPAEDTTIPIAGIEVPWSFVYSTALPSLGPVPITPIATGRIKVSGVLAIKNNTGGTAEVNLVIRVGAGTLDFPLLEALTAATGYQLIPFHGETSAAEVLPLGATVNVRIFVTSPDEDTGVELVALNSTIEVQEVPIPTG